MKNQLPGIVLSLVATILLLLSSNCSAQNIRWSLPLKGISGKDYWINCYVDHDTGTNVLDGYCGSKTYNGHRGTDFAIRDFKLMDSGVNVYSIADGVVLETVEGQYDRRKKWVDGVQGNYIGIIHGRYMVYYWHFRKKSILVKQGDSVKTGQVIGLVGSSGYSSGPHLHLEVKEEGKIIDPFRGKCNSDQQLFWEEEPRYDTSLQVVDMGLTPYVPNEDTLKERFMVKDTFRINKDTVVNFWIQTHGLRPGDDTYVEWIKPGGKLWHKHEYKWVSHWWFNYSWFYIDMPKITGAWTVRYYVNGKLIASKKFWVGK